MLQILHNLLLFKPKVHVSHLHLLPPSPCAFILKTGSSSSWRESSWWIAGGVKVSTTRDDRRNESMSSSCALCCCVSSICTLLPSSEEAARWSHQRLFLQHVTGCDGGTLQWKHEAERVKIKSQRDKTVDRRQKEEGGINVQHRLKNVGMIC